MMKSMLITLLAVCLLTSQGCSPVPAEQKDVVVRHRGALKNLMHKGDLSAKADLSELADVPHLFALGAVENLKGEILVWNGEYMISSVQNEQLQIEAAKDTKAALLVYATVSEWETVVVPEHVKTQEELELFVEEAALAAEIDTEQPFPFLLKGTAADFDWHVIDWPEGDSVHTHEKHVRSGLHGKYQNADVEVLGFYSKHHHAVFTHHTTNMHLHVRTRDGKLAGHLDGLELGEGMRLWLPAAG